jgi:hypothetical protein
LDGTAGAFYSAFKHDASLGHPSVSFYLWV